MPFARLKLIEPLLRAVESEGYTIPTVIQEEAIPHVLEGKDLQGCAQTGTGKTAAFALPILQLLSGREAPKPKKGRGKHAGPDRPIRAMVLTPTRELAAQIADSFRVYGQHTGLRQTVIFGGVSQIPQVEALRRGVDIVVATPGRLLDLLQQKMLSLGQVEILVLDETDRMLDMGFIQDVRRIVAHMPTKRQTLMFSATMPSEIQGLAETLLNDPVEVRVASESMEADTVEQILYLIDTHSKPALLKHVIQNENIERALVFTRTKHSANRVAHKLSRAGIRAEAMHSDKSQNARMRALADFKRGTIRVLVASDIAARGLDVDNISHVINYDMPDDPKNYVHRIGRTGRAGLAGQAISFCSPDQRDKLADVERLLGKRITLLPHAIKPPPGSASSRASSSHESEGHYGKSRTPEQQKNDFWRRKRKDNKRPPRASHSSRRVR
jgi:ATP-dependent RNA helicase RhlE